MAPRKPLAPTPAVVVSASDEAATLPLVESIGITKVARGWVVVLLATRGDRVVSKEILSVDPEPKAHAAMRAQMEITKTFVAPNGRGSAS